MQDRRGKTLIINAVACQRHHSEYASLHDLISPPLFCSDLWGCLNREVFLYSYLHTILIKDTTEAVLIPSSVQLNTSEKVSQHVSSQTLLGIHFCHTIYIRHLIWILFFGRPLPKLTPTSKVSFTYPLTPPMTPSFTWGWYYWVGII